MANQNSLPQTLTSFVGREQEIQAITGLIGDNHLVTLVGPGGAGKTRLAIQVARCLPGDAYEAVWFVRLDTISDPQLVAEAVISAVGARDGVAPKESPEATLVEYLGDKRALVILDNCEHLLEPCAQLANTIAASCANLRILATSRQALRVEGEQTWQLSTLSAPETGRVPLEALESYDAVRLFVDRARQSRPGFELDSDNSAAVAQLSARLDGLPLALELAAARVKVLSVQEIVDRLDERFRLFSTDNQLAMPRMKSLTALMDWSYELLSPAEQALLRSLSVFAGGFRLDAAVAISGGEIDEYEVIDLLANLVDKSLVIMEVRGGLAYYRMLETIREYAYNRLREAGEVEATRALHRDWYLSLLEAAQPHLVSSDQAEWFDRMELGHNNLRAALDWSIRVEKNPEKALRLSSCIWRFWDTRGYLTEGRRWLDEALAIPGDVPLLLRARALTAAANLAVGQGDFARAEALHSEALRLRREVGDTKLIAASLSNLGVVARSLGDLDRALALYHEAFVLLSESGNTAMAGSLLGNMGFLAQQQQNYERAEELYMQALELSRSSGDAQGEAIALNNLGETAQARGEYERAREFYMQGLETSEKLGDRLGRAGIINNLANLAYHEGKHEEAIRLYLDSLIESQALGHIPGIIECLEGLAIEEIGVNDERAARLMGAATTLRENIGAPISPNERAEYDAHLATLKAALGKRFEPVLAAGKSLPMDRAIALAMEVQAVPRPGLPPGGTAGRKRANKVDRDKNPWGLTAKQIEVLRLAARSLSNAQIAEELVLSPRTIDAHLYEIYQAMGVSTRLAAVQLAKDHGLI